MEPYSYQMKRDQEGRIVEKAETVKSKTVIWAYTYDKGGRLSEAKLDNRIICQCHYDKQGRRMQDYFPRTHGSQIRNFQYTLENRLQSAGNNGYTHDKSGFRMLWNAGGKYTRYSYAPDHRLLKVEEEERGRVFEFSHDGKGRREAKHLNGKLLEAYQWQDDVLLAAFWSGQAVFELLYEGQSRTPYAMHGKDGDVFYLYYDQVGSLRVVADRSGNVIKEVLYDPFGGIVEDTNHGFVIPIGFAGGLHDRDLGFVRFGWRDYDTFTGRWTAPDPMGDAGGDDDWYGYCLDDPVNLVDPTGLMGSEPEPPDETEMYPSGDYQWQTQPGACDKCGWLDGNYYQPGAEPEAPHPNCKCKLVECFYGSEYTEWKKYEEEKEQNFPSPIVFPFSLNVINILWVQTTHIKEKRTRTMFKQCGERKDILGKRIEYRKRVEEDAAYSQAIRAMGSSHFLTTNPWPPFDTRRGEVKQSH